MRFATCPKSLIELRSSSTASESKALWIRLETVAMSVAMRLAWAVSWPMSGSVAPGHRRRPDRGGPGPARGAVGWLGRRPRRAAGGGARGAGHAAAAAAADPAG